MNMQMNKHLQLSLLGGAIAAVLVSGIAIASVAFTAQSSSGIVAPAEAPEAAVASATRARRCAECGVIESVLEIKAPDEIAAVTSPRRIRARSHGEIEAKPRGNYAITIRMQDGSKRVITDAKPATWRHGEPVTIIAGVN